MRPEDVPQEWVDVLRAEMNVWPSTADLRAALAAVAPLITAREREECAVEAERIGAARAFDAYDDWESWESAAHKIAAVIRARGTP